jgi:hypothetical protein
MVLPPVHISEWDVIDKFTAFQSGYKNTSRKIGAAKQKCKQRQSNPITGLDRILKLPDF